MNVFQEGMGFLSIWSVARDVTIRNGLSHIALFIADQTGFVERNTLDSTHLFASKRKVLKPRDEGLYVLRFPGNVWR